MTTNPFAMCLVLALTGTLAPVEVLAEPENSDPSFVLAKAMQDVRRELHHKIADGVVTVQVMRNERPLGLLNLLQNQIGARQYVEWHDGKLLPDEIPLWQSWSESFLRTAKERLAEASMGIDSTQTLDVEGLLTGAYSHWNEIEEPLRRQNPDMFLKFRQSVETEIKAFADKQNRPRQPSVVRQSTGFVFAPGVVVTTLDIATPRNDQEWIRVYSDKQIAFSTGELLGSDKETNIAVIRLSTPGAALEPTIDFSNVAAPDIGSYVFSFYHAFNQPLSMRTAEITGVERRLPFFRCATFLETSLPTSPGTLGSPIVDLDGRLVGMTTVFMSQGTMSEVTFALPTSYLKPAVEQIRKHQHVERGCLGVFVDERPRSDGNGTEVHVRQVLEESPAFGAGVRVGDIIVALENIPVHCRGTLIEAISHFKPYDEVSVDIERDKHRQTLRISLAPLPLSTSKSR